MSEQWRQSASNFTDQCHQCGRTTTVREFGHEFWCAPCDQEDRLRTASIVPLAEGNRMGSVGYGVGKRPD
jgi:predicted RNA-binding Zn-ribbon protein involved in translation (DUF1610 family)